MSKALTSSRTRDRKLSESHYAKKVVRYLERAGWEVYKEVQCPNKRFVADIFAVKRNERGKIIDSWAIETKTTFGMAVMEQASNWQRYAHRTSVAVPMPKARRARSFGYKLCGLLGIGVIEVSRVEVRERLTAKTNRVPKLPTLVDEQKNSEAGNAKGEHWTPFKDTARKLEQLVTSEPGISLEIAVTRIDHHYKHDRSAISSLKKHLKEGVIPTVKIKWYRQVAYLYPTR